MLLVGALRLRAAFSVCYAVIVNLVAIRKTEVTKLAQSNIFEAGAAEIPQLFADYIEPSEWGQASLALALSARKLGSVERNAIEKSLAALGLGEHSCTYATLYPQVNDSGAELDAQALFLLVEGLDPLRLIIADAQTLEIVGRAYRMALGPDRAVRIFGRPAVCFGDLRELLQSDSGKQRAWALFKTLA